MKIALVGDVMLGRLVNDVLCVKPPEYPWGDTLSVLEKMDVRLCNLECVLSDIGSPWSETPKMFHFRSDEKNIASLKVAHIDMVSIANNHVLDFGREAFSRMLSILDQYALQRAGSGENLNEARKMAVHIYQGKKIGLIACTDNEPVWEATENRSGVFYIPIRRSDQRVKGLFHYIQEAKKSVDFLILSLHWGPNWGYELPEGHQEFAHRLIDAGANVIFGHSGHVCRGIEVYKGCPILFCAGDFIDDYAIDPQERNDESCIFILETDTSLSKVRSIHIIPTIIQQFQACLAPKAQADKICQRMKKLSSQLGQDMRVHNHEAIVAIS